ncbi:hypothetical protein HK098_003894 [Nowakowskiella sp. JEL0407]|nr:hypothetical protein HK098_003894 [Nowakowskiella sp. JEL0407]
MANKLRLLVEIFALSLPSVKVVLFVDVYSTIRDLASSAIERYLSKSNSHLPTQFGVQSVILCGFEQDLSDSVQDVLNEFVNANSTIAEKTWKVILTFQNTAQDLNDKLRLVLYSPELLSNVSCYLSETAKIQLSSTCADLRAALFGEFWKNVTFDIETSKFQKFLDVMKHPSSLHNFRRHNQEVTICLYFDMLPNQWDPEKKIPALKSALDYLGDRLESVSFEINVDIESTKVFGKLCEMVLNSHKTLKSLNISIAGGDNEYFRDLFKYSLPQLSQLEELKIASDYFTPPFEISLAKLSRLKTFSLLSRETKIDDVVVENITNALSSCESLTSFEIDGLRNFAGRIPDLLQKNRIRSLTIDSPDNFEKGLFAAVAAGLRNNSELQHLSFGSFASIDSESIKPVFEAISKNDNNFEQLVLPGISFRSAGFSKALKDFLWKNRNLRSLDISNMEYRLIDFDPEFLKGLDVNKRLESLGCLFMKVSEDSIMQLANTLRTNEHLKRIALSGSKFQGSVDPILASITLSKHLTSINFDSVVLKSHAASIAEMLRSNLVLTEIVLSSCGFETYDCVLIIDGLLESQVTSRELDLRSNQITTVALTGIFDRWMLKSYTFSVKLEEENDELNIICSKGGNKMNIYLSKVNDNDFDVVFLLPTNCPVINFNLGECGWRAMNKFKTFVHIIADSEISLSPKSTIKTVLYFNDNSVVTDLAQAARSFWLKKFQLNPAETNLFVVSVLLRGFEQQSQELISEVLNDFITPELSIEEKTWTITLANDPSVLFPDGSPKGPLRKRNCASTPILSLPADVIEALTCYLWEYEKINLSSTCAFLRSVIFVGLWKLVTLSINSNNTKKFLDMMETPSSLINFRRHNRSFTLVFFRVFPYSSNLTAPVASQTAMAILGCLGDHIESVSIGSRSDIGEEFEIGTFYRMLLVKLGDSSYSLKYIQLDVKDDREVCDFLTSLLKNLPMLEELVLKNIRIKYSDSIITVPNLPYLKRVKLYFEDERVNYDFLICVTDGLILCESLEDLEFHGLLNHVGKLPEILARRQIKFLRFDSHLYEDQFFEEIANGIRKSTSLHTLDFGSSADYDLSGIKPVYDANLDGGLALNELVIPGFNLSNFDQVDCFRKFLSKTPNLQKLNFSGRAGQEHELENEFIGGLFEELHTNEHTSVLVCRNHCLSDASIGQLVSMLRSNKYLRELDLSGCFFDVEPLLSSLSNNRNLKSLRLSGIELDPYGEFVTKFLLDNSVMNFIALNDCSLADDVCILIINGLFSNRTLSRTLEIKHNQLTKFGMTSICDMWESAPSKFRFSIKQIRNEYMVTGAFMETGLKLNLMLDDSFDADYLRRYLQKLKI